MIANVSLKGATGAVPGSDPRADLKKAAQAFESVFARQLIASMRSSSLGDDLFGSDAANQFRDMSDERLADSMSSSGSLGLAAMIEKQMSALLPPVPAATEAAPQTGTNA